MQMNYLPTWRPLRGPTPPSLLGLVLELATLSSETHPQLTSSALSGSRCRANISTLPCDVCIAIHFMLRAAVLLSFLRRILRFSTTGHPGALGACYVASWQLPRLDFHQLADDSLSGHTKPTVRLWKSVCQPLFQCEVSDDIARSKGITQGHVLSILSTLSGEYSIPHALGERMAARGSERTVRRARRWATPSGFGLSNTNR